MLIDGLWRGSEDGEEFDVHTPIDGSVIAKAQLGTRRDVDAATRAAKEKRGIRSLPAIERIEVFNCAAGMLEKHRDEFVTVLQLEAGKTLTDAEGEFYAALQRLRLTMEEARRIFGEYIPGDWSMSTLEKMALVIREPVGVVAAIIPFNYPLFIAATKIIPALLAGNSDEMTNLKTIVFNLGPAGLGKKEQRAAACRIGILPKPPEPENGE